MKKTNKALSLMLVIAMLAGIFAMSGTTAFAQDDVVSHLTYEIKNGEVTITDYDNSLSGDLVLPDTIEGYPVTAIGYYAFYYCSDIPTITIPASVSHIDSRAFAHASFKKIYVAEENASYSNDENGVLFNKDKTKLVHFPTYADGNEYRYGMDTYNIPASVTVIGEYAFYKCANLRYINIPATVKTIEKYAFFDASSIGSISVDENNENYASENGALLNKDKTVLIKGFASIPEGTIIIEDYAFYNASAFDYDLTIPDSVTTIKDYAFPYSVFKTINIGSGLSYIGEMAFYYCLRVNKINVSEENKYFSSDETGVLFNKDKTELMVFPLNSSFESYTIPDSVITISDYAFNYCDLTELNFGKNIKTIGREAFSSCHGLTGSLILPDSVETIGYEAFSYNDFTDIYFGAGTKYIDSSAFFSSEDLTYISVSEDNEYYSNDENGIMFNKDKTKLVMYPCCISNTEYIIPDTVTEIGAHSFFGCENLTAVTLHDNVKRIGEWAFGACVNLKSINIPYGIEKIPFYAFGATAIENFVIPASVSVIEATFFNVNEAPITVTVLNPDCSFPGTAYEDEYFPSFYSVSTICGYEGSTAQEYAKEYNINFVVIEKPECAHENTAIINISASDCENDGYSGDVFCNDCKEIISYGEVTPATGHNYIENIITAPTYTQDGLKNTVCENCGDTTEDEIIPKLEADEDLPEEDETETETPDIGNEPEDSEDNTETEETSVSFIDKIVEFFNKIIEFIKNLFGIK